MYIKLLAVIASVVLVTAIAVNTIRIEIVDGQSSRGDPGVGNEKNRCHRYNTVYYRILR